MRGDVPERATGGAGLDQEVLGAPLTENRLSCSGADSGPGLVLEDDGSVAVRSYVPPGREFPDDGTFTETTCGSGLGGTDSKVSENPERDRSMYLSSSYRLRCTHVPGVLLSHESWECLGRWKAERYPQGTESGLVAELIGYLWWLVWKQGLRILCRGEHRTLLSCVPLTPRVLRPVSLL